MELKVISLNNSEYYDAKELIPLYPIKFKGISRDRQVIDKFKLKDNEYVFGSSLKGVWKISERKNLKARSLIIKSWCETNIPNFNKYSENKSNSNTKMETKVESKEKSIYTQVLDEKLNKKSENKVIRCEIAPPILELEDDEKFKTVDGKIMNIEIRGERHVDKCYFRITDIEKEFGCGNIRSIIHRDKKNNYNDDDYVKFRCNVSVNNVHADITTGKDYLFFTYYGLLRYLYTQRTINCDNFTKWMSQILFTHQLGTQDQKQTLASNLLGEDPRTVKQIFGKLCQSPPCIYLIFIKNLPDGKLLCKYGRTDSLVRRLNEHQLKYKKEFNVEGITLLYMSIIENRNLVTAEDSIRQFFKAYEYKHDGDDATALAIDSKTLTLDSKALSIDSKTPSEPKYNELVAIDNSLLSVIKNQYNMIQNTYIGSYLPLIEKIKELENEIMKKDTEIAKKDYELKLEKEKAIRDRELYEKDMEHLNEKHELILKNKDTIIEKKDLELELYKLRAELQSRKMNDN
jgi:hypothetical protein